MTEQEEICIYESYLHEVRTCDAQDDEIVSDLVARMYEAARRTKQITSDMHARLCDILAKRTAYEPPLLP